MDDRITTLEVRANDSSVACRDIFVQLDRLIHLIGPYKSSASLTHRLSALEASNISIRKELLRLYGVFDAIDDLSAVGQSTMKLNHFLPTSSSTKCNAALQGIPKRLQIQDVEHSTPVRFLDDDEVHVPPFLSSSPVRFLDVPKVSDHNSILNDIPKESISGPCSKFRPNTIEITTISTIIDPTDIQLQIACRCTCCGFAWFRHAPSAMMAVSDNLKTTLRTMPRPKTETGGIPIFTNHTLSANLLTDVKLSLDIHKNDSSKIIEFASDNGQEYGENEDQPAKKKKRKKSSGVEMELVKGMDASIDGLRRDVELLLSKVVGSSDLPTTLTTPGDGVGLSTFKKGRASDVTHYAQLENSLTVLESKMAEIEEVVKHSIKENALKTNPLLDVEDARQSKSKLNLVEAKELESFRLKISNFEKELNKRDAVDEFMTRLTTLPVGTVASPEALSALALSFQVLRTQISSLQSDSLSTRTQVDQLASRSFQRDIEILGEVKKFCENHADELITPLFKQFFPAVGKKSSEAAASMIRSMRNLTGRGGLARMYLLEEAVRKLESQFSDEVRKANDARLEVYAANLRAVTDGTSHPSANLSSKKAHGGTNLKSNNPSTNSPEVGGEGDIRLLGAVMKDVLGLVRETAKGQRDINSRLAALESASETVNVDTIRRIADLESEMKSISPHLYISEKLERALHSGMSDMYSIISDVTNRIQILEHNFNKHAHPGDPLANPESTAEALNDLSMRMEGTLSKLLSKFSSLNAAEDKKMSPNFVTNFEPNRRVLKLNIKNNSDSLNRDAIPNNKKDESESFMLEAFHALEERRKKGSYIPLTPQKKNKVEVAINTTTSILPTSPQSPLGDHQSMNDNNVFFFKNNPQNENLILSKQESTQNESFWSPNPKNSPLKMIQNVVYNQNLLNMLPQQSPHAAAPPSEVSVTPGPLLKDRPPLQVGDFEEDYIQNKNENFQIRKSKPQDLQISEDAKGAITNILKKKEKKFLKNNMFDVENAKRRLIHPNHAISPEGPALDRDKNKPTYPPNPQGGIVDIGLPLVVDGLGVSRASGIVLGSPPSSVVGVEDGITFPSSRGGDGEENASKSRTFDRENNKSKVRISTNVQIFDVEQPMYGDDDDAFSNNEDDTNDLWNLFANDKNSSSSKVNVLDVNNKNNNINDNNSDDDDDYDPKVEKQKKLESALLSTRRPRMMRVPEDSNGDMSSSVSPSRRFQLDAVDEDPELSKIVVVTKKTPKSSDIVESDKPKTKNKNNSQSKNRDEPDAGGLLNWFFSGEQSDPDHTSKSEVKKKKKKKSTKSDVEDLEKISPSQNSVIEKKEEEKETTQVQPEKTRKTSDKKMHEGDVDESISLVTLIDADGNTIIKKKVKKKKKKDATESSAGGGGAWSIFG